MRNIKILVDSCSDLTDELMSEYDIDYCKMNTVYKDKETPASLSWEHYSPRELYDIMRGGERVLTTQVPIEEFERVFKKYLDLGFDIIYIGCSLKQSGSVNTGKVFSKEILEDYPGARIECIDSLNACIGEGMLGIYASELVRNGDDFDSVVSKVMDRRNNVREYATVHTLEWLRKSGRVKATSAYFGDVLNIKPILIADAEGYQSPIKKVRGRRKSLDELVSLMAETIENQDKQTVYLAHADVDESEITYLKDRIMSIIRPKAVKVIYIGPIIGASVGPETIGIWAFGRKLEESASAEESK